MSRPKLDCTQEQWESLHHDVDHTRSTSATVKVNKGALLALLIDHARLLKEHERANW